MHISTSTFVPGVILLTTLGLVGCATSPPRSAAERQADAETANRVEAVLNADPNIFARHIDVRVDRGVAYLNGFVWSTRDFLLAKNDAASVSGVSKVVSDMELMRGGVSGTSR